MVDRSAFSVGRDSISACNASSRRGLARLRTVRKRGSESRGRTGNSPGSKLPPQNCFQIRHSELWQKTGAMGKGLEGKGHGSDKGPITVAMRVSARSGSHPLRLVSISYATRILSRQRSRVRAPSSPPYIPKEFSGMRKPRRVQKDIDLCLFCALLTLISAGRVWRTMLQNEFPWLTEQATLRHPEQHVLME